MKLKGTENLCVYLCRIICFPKFLGSGKSKASSVCLVYDNVLINRLAHFRLILLLIVFSIFTTVYLGRNSFEITTIF